MKYPSICLIYIYIHIYILHNPILPISSDFLSLGRLQMSASQVTPDKDAHGPALLAVAGFLFDVGRDRDQSFPVFPSTEAGSVTVEDTGIGMTREDSHWDES